MVASGVFGNGIGASPWDRGAIFCVETVLDRGGEERCGVFLKISNFNLRLIMSSLRGFWAWRLVKNFTNSLDCHAEPYLNRGQFLEQPYGSPLSSPFIHELIYPTHGEYFSKVEQLAPN
jgi:hypothetical protein